MRFIVLFELFCFFHSTTLTFFWVIWILFNILFEFIHCSCTWGRSNIQSFSIKYDVIFSNDFIRLRKLSSVCGLTVFIRGCWTLLNEFSTSIKMIVCFVLHSINRTYYSRFLLFCILQFCKYRASSLFSSPHCPLWFTI